jgi:predicted transglutaminase-like cysteine proteinase
MFASRGSRAVARIAMLTAATIVVASPAIARKATRASNAAAYDAASLIPMPKFSGSNGEGRTQAAALPQAPARFFTINAALAKRDTSGPTNGPVRLAAAVANEDLADVLEKAPPPVPPAAGNEPFGMHAFRAPEGMLWSKWRTLVRESKDEDARLTSCQNDPASCSDEASRFWSLVDRVKASGGRARLERTNQLVNGAIAYASDISMHGELDRWSAPLATLRRGRGDCEDYAILKYRILIATGVPASDLRIVLVRDTAVRIDHAVLSARADNRWYVLDNRKSGFYGERELPHYMPLFALDESGVKLFAAPYASARSVEAAILPGFDDAQSETSVGSGMGLPLLM